MNTRIPALGAVAALTLLLGACATPTPYQARGVDDGQRYGYAEQKLEDNRYRVTFAGNSLTSRETVELYLLYRSAELTLANGYDYFVMTTQDTGADTQYRRVISPGFGFGYYDWYSPVGFGVETVDADTQFEARAVILMFKGKKPASDPNAFDARAVRDNIGPRLVKPKTQ